MLHYIKFIFFYFLVLNHSYSQELTFSDLKGVWRCVRVVSHEGDETWSDIPVAMDYYFTDSNLFYFTYPCDGGPPIDGAEIRHDTLVIPNEYHEMNLLYRLELKGDTLIAHDFDGPISFEYGTYETRETYFLRIETDKKIIDELLTLHFSPSCLNNIFTFGSVRDSTLDRFYKSDQAIFKHVPERFEFVDGVNDRYYVEGKFIYSKESDKPVFSVEYISWWPYDGKIVKGMIAFTDVSGKFAGKYRYVYSAEYPEHKP